MVVRQSKLMLIILGVIAVFLIGGGWLFFSLLSNQKVNSIDVNQQEIELRVLNIKGVAEENLRFFTPADGKESLWDKLDQNPQYIGLEDDARVIIDLENPGNPFPFDQPPVLVPEN